MHRFASVGASLEPNTRKKFKYLKLFGLRTPNSARTWRGTAPKWNLKARVIGQRSGSLDKKSLFNISFDSFAGNMVMAKGHMGQGQRSHGSRSKVTWVKIMWVKVKDPV